MCWSEVIFEAQTQARWNMWMLIVSPSSSRQRHDACLAPMDIVSALSHLGTGDPESPSGATSHSAVFTSYKSTVLKDPLLSSSSFRHNPPREPS
ncbi:hypothetical protein AB1N83_013046 [Pleurotus pulmonarius]